jgi:hypothetical protein
MESHIEKKELLNAAIEALSRLMRMFSAERYTYLALAIASGLLTLYTAYLMVKAESPNKETLTLLFGGSGLLTAASVRVTWFFGKAFNIFEELIRRFAK